MPEHPYLQWLVFRRSIVAAFDRSLTPSASERRGCFSRRHSVRAVERSARNAHRRSDADCRDLQRGRDVESRRVPVERWDSVPLARRGGAGCRVSTSAVGGRSRPACKAETPGPIGIRLTGYTKISKRCHARGWYSGRGCDDCGGDGPDAPAPAARRVRRTRPVGLPPRWCAS